jgi:membrane-bound serine protease (ClpP class)
MTSFLRHIAVPLLTLALSAGATSQTVRVVTIDATINPAIEHYIQQCIEDAKDAGAECLVIRLNTPGGLLQSTRVIVGELLTSPVAVVVYVAPAGAQSASAGAFITLAAHIAAMAPGTNIGAAHPVGMEGGVKDSIMNEKATNDAAAFIRTISEKRKRNVRWAEDAVRKSIAITETEALRDSVIDLVAANMGELLEKIDGREVNLNGAVHVLRTRNARIEELEMDWRHKLLNVLSNPNIAYIFFLLGLYGLLFELYNPGTVLPGVVGAICIILAFYSLHTLPLNYAGVALILVAIVLFVLEIKVTSYGLLSVGGILALFIGSIMLFDSTSSLEFVHLSWSVVIPAVLCTAGFFLFAIGMGVRAQRRKPTTGPEGIVGETGEALTGLNPGGQVRVHGEIWTASSVEGAIEPGSRVTVVKVTDLRLTVKKTV